MQGHFSVASYFQTLNTASNRKFIQSFRQEYGNQRLINAAMASAYSAVYLWKAAVEKAKRSHPDSVRQAARGLVLNTPMGTVRMNQNHHLSLPCLVGQVRQDGLFNIVHRNPTPIAPEPWSQALSATQGYACDWSDETRGEKYKVDR
jgi:urea transport system substrate-binding protein